MKAYWGSGGIAPRIFISALDEGDIITTTRLYPEVSGLAAWSDNCQWYSSLPLDAVVSLFCESV
jgi:hypothetical protein